MDDLEAPRRARLRVKVGAVVVLVLVALGCAVLVAALGDHGSAADVVRPSPTATPGVASSGGTIFVHILGAVERPGLYSLMEGDRAIDAAGLCGS